MGINYYDPNLQNLMCLYRVANFFLITLIDILCLKISKAYKVLLDT
jgi:hypothetical protein